MIIFLSTLFGLVVGSFLNVAILRGEEEESIRGRSRCRGCKKTLTAQELIPILSFLIQNGRCRNCKNPLLWQYPLVEGGTAILFAVAAWLIFENTFLAADSWSFFYLLISSVVISAGIVIFVSDLRSFIIPDGAVIILLVCAVLFIFSSAYFGAGSSYIDLGKNIVTAVVLSGFLGGLWLFSGGTWMGLGDAKLFFPLALLLGFPTSLVAFLFSFWIGSLGAIALLFLKKFGLRDHIPFGPFILIGAALAFFYTDFFLQISGLEHFF